MSVPMQSGRSISSAPAQSAAASPIFRLVAVLGVVGVMLTSLTLFFPLIFAAGPAAPVTPPPWSDPATTIELIAPVEGVAYHSPIDVTGFSRTFEGNVMIRLLDSTGEVLAERTAIGGSVDGFDFFHTYVRFTTTEVQTATLEIFDEDAETGGSFTEIQVPITLLPGQRVIDLNRPEVGAAVCDPVLLAGYSNTFEANVLVDLRQRNGELINQGFTMGGTLGAYADFSTVITHAVSSPLPVLVSAYEESADTGGWIDLARVPVTLYPAGTAQCP
jgi:hypothetical protein